MNPSASRTAVNSSRILVSTFVLLSLAFAADEKKPALPARPAVKAAAPAGKLPAAGGPHAAGAASHGPATSSPRAPGTGGGRITTGNAGAHAGAAATHGAAPTGKAGGGWKAASPHTSGPAAPGRTFTASNGNEVHMRPNGRAADVHVAGRGMDIHHGLSGNTRVEVVRADHSRVYAERGGRGYVQHPYIYRGREFSQRTYYYNGRMYDRYYSPYEYHGVYMNVYAPGYYYAPAFYGWAYNPWVSPVPYAWGWGGAPWYGYYGGYFSPYPVYPSASYWLTDYLISTSLSAAYQARAEAAAEQSAPPPGSGAALTPEVKDMIAAEVQRQIALENAEAQSRAQNAEIDPASSGIQRMLTDGDRHIFIAGRDLDLVDAAGGECPVSQGDALQLAGQPAPDAAAASLVVFSSKGGQECRRGATVSVSFEDLQDMQNHMRETIAEGMGQLRSKQGQPGGLPALPASAKAEPVKASFVAAAPPPDANAATEIRQQVQDADRAEKEVLSEVPKDSTASAQPVAVQSAPVEPAPAAPSPALSLGLSIDEIIAQLGQPKNIVDLGAKKIYLYDKVKVTFNGGKVTAIE